MQSAPAFAMCYGAADGCRYIYSIRSMSQRNLTGPICFEPIFMERIWGGRRLESEFGKRLPAKKQIGESWEIVDRPEAQSVAANGAMRGKTLHELWTQDREEVFGEAGETKSPRRPLPKRFPLLIKLLDAQEKLSLQVHPTEKIAATLGSEPKTEFWYVAAADDKAELFVGLRNQTAPSEFKNALESGTAAELVHAIRVKAGDAMFLPSGRLHAIGAGNLLVEIQQNSDTTYRVFDWNRLDENGKARELHVDQALQCIDFNDCEPQLVEPKGELLVRHDLFEVQKWNLSAPREVARHGKFAIVYCLSGKLRCADSNLMPGELFLVPASLQDRQLKPLSEGTNLLRVTIPS
jgi:mannose-6-phosphate isomerase